MYKSDNKHHLMQYRDNSTSVTAYIIHPGISVLFSYYSVARSEVECRACTREMHRLHLSSFPFLSFPFSYTNTGASHHAHASSCIRMSILPLFWDQLPLGYDFFLSPSLSPPLSLSLFLSHYLFFCFSIGLFPLSVARLVELFFVSSLSSISLLRADDR